MVADMEAWLFWLIVAVILAVGEIATTAFLLAPFAGGALLAMLAAGLGGGTVIQLVVFLVASSGLLLGLRPLARSHKRMPPQLRTGTAALIGKTGTVTERTDADSGNVRIDGDIWSARAYEQDAVLEPGARVHIVEIRGATALVVED
jgi:membrane protein implicated in regulation of membrane protease activity